jgi:hypothetical protein
VTASPDAASTGTGLAAPGLLRMVGASGAVCVDGTCSFDPMVQPPEESDRADS